MAVYTNNLIVYTGTNFEQTFVLEDNISNVLKDTQLMDTHALTVDQDKLLIHQTIRDVSHS